MMNSKVNTISSMAIMKMLRSEIKSLTIKLDIG